MKMWLELIFCKLNFVWSVCYSMCLLAWSSLVFANWTLWIYVCQVLKYLKIGVYLVSCWHLSASVGVVWIGLYFFIHRHSYDLSVNIFKSTFWTALLSIIDLVQVCLSVHSLRREDCVSFHKLTWCRISSWIGNSFWWENFQKPI